jgi:hypothetical protein
MTELGTWYFHVKSASLIKFSQNRINDMCSSSRGQCHDYSLVLQPNGATNVGPENSKGFKLFVLRSTDSATVIWILEEHGNFLTRSKIRH